MQVWSTVYISILFSLLLAVHVRSFHLTPITKLRTKSNIVSVFKRKMSSNEVNEERDDRAVPHCTNVLFVECGYVEKAKSV